MTNIKGTSEPDPRPVLRSNRPPDAVAERCGSDAELSVLGGLLPIEGER